MIAWRYLALTRLKTRRLVGEAYQVFGGAPIECILSIGTGVPAEMQFQRGIYTIKYFVAISTNSELAHQTVKKFATQLHRNGTPKYWRFNLSKKSADKIPNISKALAYENSFNKMDDSNKMKAMVELTNKWLDGEPKRVQAFIERTAYEEDDD
jgi:hypothetical protein